MFKVYPKLLSYAPEKRPLAFCAVALSFLATIVRVGAYYFLFKLLHALLVEGSTASAIQRAWIVAGLLALDMLIYFLSTWLSHLLGFRLEVNLRKHGVKGLADASFKFYDTHSSGTVRKIIDDNASMTHTIVAHLIPDQAEAILAPVLIVSLAFVIDWRLGVSLLVVIVITGLFFKLMFGGAKFMEAYQQKLDEMAKNMVEFVRGIPVVKIFGVGVNSFESLVDAIKGYGELGYKYSLSCRKGYVPFQLMFFGIAAFAVPLVLLFTKTGVVDASGAELAVWLIMLFFLTGCLMSSIMKVMYVDMYARQGIMAVEKLEALFRDVDQDSLSFGTDTCVDSADVEFNNVTFSYGSEEDSPKVCEGLSFSLEEGKTYALVGPSGGGKSTICKLLSGFYRVDSGRILIGGKPLETYSEKTVMDTIAYVFQDVRLFKRSLFDNVRIAKPSASRAEVLAAMKSAGCDSILDKFPERENTIYGSQGVYLSGGEKQRLAIARALLKDAKIVVFDEASAAIDPDNEFVLQQAFARLMQGKTVIMIAHRLSSIRNVDEILVIDEGRVIERGTNAELMSIDSKYKYLQEQFNRANEWDVQNA